MSGAGGAAVLKYTRVKSSVLAPVSLDPVEQHMNAWHLRQHHRLVSNARSREQAHVNPGLHSRKNRGKHGIANHRRSYAATQMTLDTTRIINSPSFQDIKYCPSVIDSILQTPQLDRKVHSRSQPLHWQAHEASHAKQAQGQEHQPFFRPKILETKATSRLIQSRNYQQPRRTTARQRPANLCVQQERAVAKVWLVPSSSSSSSGDSAYEAGGSSPASRGSTPRDLSQESQHMSSRHNSSSASSSQSASSWESPEISCGKSEHEQNEQREPKIDKHCSDQTIRNEQLEYAMFEHDLMNEILSVGLLTNAAVKQICRAHVLTHSDGLQKDKMEEIVVHLQKVLDIPCEDKLDTVCFGLGGSQNNQTRSFASMHSIGNEVDKGCETEYKSSWTNMYDPVIEDKSSQDCLLISNVSEK